VKLTALQCFVAVVESGSIHGAARKLGLSQPALTKALRNLEQDLGVQLVVRTTRGSLPTEFAMLATNDLLAMLPRPFVELPQLSGLLVRVPVREKTRDASIGLAQRADSPLTPAAQALAERIRAAAAEFRRKA